jgi:hypothetical protein
MRGVSKETEERNFKGRNGAAECCRTQHGPWPHRETTAGGRVPPMVDRGWQACKVEVRRNDELRESVSAFINSKVEARDEAALVWLLQRTVFALREVYPADRGAKMIRRHVDQVLSEGRS